MINTIEIIAKELANKNCLLRFTSTSVFNLLDITNISSDSVNLISDKIAKSAIKDINTFKNIYLPEVNEYAEIIKKELNTVDDTNALSRYKIIESYIPSILDYYKEKGIMVPKRAIGELPTQNISIPLPKDDVDILDYFKVSNPIEQKYIDAVLVEYGGINKIKDLWETNLLSITNSGIYALHLNLNEKIYEIILLDRIVLKLKDTKPSGVTISDQLYTYTMNELHNILLNLMSIFVFNYNKNVKLDKVIVKYKRNSKTELIVNKEVYNKLLDSVTSDAILGYIAGGYKYVYSKDIIDNSETLIKAWENKVKLTNRISGITKVKRYKAVYGKCLPSVGNYNINKLEAYDKVNDLLSDFKDVDITNIDKMAAHIIGAIIYPETNFLKFIGYMENHMGMDNKLTTVEAASLATIDIVIDYLLAQIDVDVI